MRTYIRVTYVAMSQYGKPIATAHTEKDLKAGIDEYYGIGTDPKVKYIDWTPYDSKYPDDFEGSYRYEVDDFNGGLQVETVRVYCVEFYPHTKYEVEDDRKQDLVDLMDHDKEAGLYDIHIKHNTDMTDKVKEAIHCFKHSTPEMYEADHDKAVQHESRIFELFKEMTDEELNDYRDQLVKLGYVDRSEYSRSENGLITQKTFAKDEK